MRLRYLFLVSTLCLGGCIGNMALDTMSASENNISNLWRISKGMSQTRVLQIMHKPFDYETFQFDEDIYDVWFYITRMTALGQTRLVPQNLTPLTFKNGVLVDVGYVYYNYLVKEEGIRAKIGLKPTLETPQLEESPENLQLEKALQTPPGSPATPSTPATPSSPGKPAAPIQPASPAQPTPSQTPSSPKPTQQPKNTQPNTQPAQKPAATKPSDQGYVPKNQLPGRPSKPATPPPNQLPGQQPPSSTTSQNLSMCTKPREPQPSTGSVPTSSDPAPSSESESDEKEKYPGGQKWDSEDQRMQEQENEQDFDYW